MMMMVMMLEMSQGNLAGKNLNHDNRVMKVMRMVVMLETVTRQDCLHIKGHHYDCFYDHNDGDAGNVTRF